MKRFVYIFLIFIILVLNIYLYENKTLISLVCDDFSIIEYDFAEDWECVSLDANIEKVVDALDVEIVEVVELEGRKILEGYTSKLCKNKSVDGRKINIQLSEFGESVVVGYPLIKKSF